MKKYLVLCLLLLLPMGIHASDFLMLTELGTSAQTIALGNILGFEYTANGVFENPATLVNVPKTSVSIFSTKLAGELGVSAIAGSILTPFGVVGVGYLQGNVGGVYNTGSTANIFFIKNDFTYGDQMLRLAYARTLNETAYIGAAISSYQKSIGSFSGQGMSLDIGLYEHFEQADVSFLIKNAMGNKVLYSNGISEDLKPQFVLGAKLPVGPVNVLAQLKNQGGKPLLKSLAIQVPAFGVDSVECLASYKEYWVLDEVKSGFSVGLNFSMHPVVFSYALENGSFIEESYKHYFSISTTLEWGGAPSGLEVEQVQ